jgi:dethiobiotin synthetase
VLSVTVLVITGTDTGVGKTVVTAAIAAAAGQLGLRVAVVKPAQTGTATGAETDADTVARLAAPATVRTLSAYPAPLAPLTAARVAGLPPLEPDLVLSTMEQFDREHDLVLVEGAGGLLVPMGVAAWTVADLASALDAEVVVVSRAGLGTLNHTALTLEALERRDIGACVVIGSWPATPELVHRTNRAELAGELAGVLPEGAPDRADFRTAAATWLAPALYGTATGLRDA